MNDPLQTLANQVHTAVIDAINGFVPEGRETDAVPVISGAMAAVLQFTAMANPSDAAVRAYLLRIIDEGLPQIRLHTLALQHGVKDGLEPRGRA